MTVYLTSLSSAVESSRSTFFMKANFSLFLVRSEMAFHVSWVEGGVSCVSVQAFLQATEQKYFDLSLLVYPSFWQHSSWRAFKQVRLLAQ